MRATKDIMGMPIEIDVPRAPRGVLDSVFDFFTEIDEQFSTYKSESEISRINRGELTEGEWSVDMHEVFALAERTKQESGGFFDVQRPDGMSDPSGIVKGWAIRKAALLIERLGYRDYFLNVGGDIASKGLDEHGAPWTVGIRNPFNRSEIIKVVRPEGRGVATSGNYIRGDHIYNPHSPHDPLRELASITVIGPDICEADRFATAAFAMGAEGIQFIESLPQFEGYSIDPQGIATMTSGFQNFVA